MRSCGGGDWPLVYHHHIILVIINGHLGDAGAPLRESEAREERLGNPEHHLVLRGQVAADDLRPCVLILTRELGALPHQAHGGHTLPGHGPELLPEVDLGHVLLQHHLRPEEALTHRTLEWPLGPPPVKSLLIGRGRGDLLDRVSVPDETLDVLDTVLLSGVFIILLFLWTLLKVICFPLGTGY